MADGTVCRAAGGDCDIEERCDGLNATCPSDALVAQGTTCREAAGLCDLEEACTGADTACPSDEQAVAGVTCRPSAGGCDIAEVCSGGVNDCPSDTLVSNGQVGECAPYVCSGVAACPTSCTLSTECAVGHGCSDGVCVPAKRIFVTSTTYTGNLGGAAGADALCQGRADSVSLGGTWRAWISTITSSAATRLTHFAGPYVQVNRTKIADSWADLTDGSLDLGITVSESGQAFAVQSTRYWTGSSTSGNATLATCMGFTNATSGFNGDTGLVGFTTSAWTSSGADGCSASWRLVCIEQ